MTACMGCIILHDTLLYSYRFPTSLPIRNHGTDFAGSSRATVYMYAPASFLPFLILRLICSFTPNGTHQNRRRPPVPHKIIANQIRTQHTPSASTPGRRKAHPRRTSGTRGEARGARRRKCRSCYPDASLMPTHPATPPHARAPHLHRRARTDAQRRLPRSPPPRLTTVACTCARVLAEPFYSHAELRRRRPCAPRVRLRLLGAGAPLAPRPDVLRG